MAPALISQPVLAAKARDPREHILEALAEMDEQIDLLRKRKVGAAFVESEAVESLRFLVKRTRGDVRRLVL